jgi:FKBP-type peptidyl-prolyl cis-trans isomerase FkpA
MRRTVVRAIVRAGLAAPALAGVLAGCTSPVSPSHYAPFSQSDLREGTGAAAAEGDLLTVHYTGWLYDRTKPEQKGAVFDTSFGQEPFVFTLGDAEVIEGWDRGLVGMKEGGLRRLVIPPSLGYEDFRRDSIPPYATMLFEVELLDVE